MRPRPPRRLRALPRSSIDGADYPIATTLRARLLGLALLDRERAGPGLLIPHCRSIHTFGMRFALDVVFLDRSRREIGRRERVAPGRIVREPVAAHVLELPTE